MALRTPTFVFHQDGLPPIEQITSQSRTARTMIHTEKDLGVDSFFYLVREDRHGLF